MREIAISVPWQMVEERRACQYLFMRFLGPRKRVMIPLSIVVPFLVGAALLHNLTSLDMLRAEVALAVLLFYCSIACWMYTVTHFNKLVDIAVAKVPTRQNELEWILSAKGIKGEGPIRPWSDVIEVLHHRGQTLLVLSLRLIIILPDAALPTGINPETLQAQIGEWRK